MTTSMQDSDDHRSSAYVIHPIPKSTRRIKAAISGAIGAVIAGLIAIGLHNGHDLGQYWYWILVVVAIAALIMFLQLYTTERKHLATMYLGNI